MASSFLILLEGVKLMCSSVSLLCIEKSILEIELKTLFSVFPYYTLARFNVVSNLLEDMHGILNEAHPMLVEVNILEDPTGIAGIPWKQHGSK